ncbi:hypothetical protein CICLE_v10003056mg [Citrus x clementina]|uniref:Uncharacterized protein n=1 Tax=Citrus clementina TaxID=85681 RepID=V4V682_CITCL|nr:hypothetical protein CICLE_v10003056mg [Citrus x clementina]
MNLLHMPACSHDSRGTWHFDTYGLLCPPQLATLHFFQCLKIKLICLFHFNDRRQTNSTNHETYPHFVCSYI